MKKWMMKEQGIKRPQTGEAVRGKKTLLRMKRRER
jgi:hypothetical protein